MTGAGSARLWAEHEPMLRRVIRRWFGGTPEAVEDLLQETAVRALSSLHRLRAPAAMDAFLVGTALNVVRREIRRRVRDRRFAGDTALDEVPAPVVSPERRAEAQRLLRRLPRRDRRLVLMWAAGVSLRELADDEGVTPAVVKRRLATARHRAGLDRR